MYVSMNELYICRYPAHKGLLKNFSSYLKQNPQLGVLKDYLPFAVR